MEVTAPRVCGSCGSEVTDESLKVCPNCWRPLFVSQTPVSMLTDATLGMRQCSACGTQIGRPEMIACPTCGLPLAISVDADMADGALQVEAATESAVGVQRHQLIVSTPWGPVEISDDPVAFGRDANFSRFAAQLAHYDNVSRRHAVLRAGEGFVIVEDRESQNGTYIDGARVGRDDEGRARPGSVIHLGRDPAVEIRVIR